MTLRTDETEKQDLRDWNHEGESGGKHGAVSSDAPQGQPGAILLPGVPKKAPVELSADDEVAKNLNTDRAAQRMTRCLSHYKKLRLQEIADEMPAISSCHASERSCRWQLL